MKLTIPNCFSSTDLQRVYVVAYIPSLNDIKLQDLAQFVLNTQKRAEQDRPAGDLMLFASDSYAEAIDFYHEARQLNGLPEDTSDLDPLGICADNDDDLDDDGLDDLFDDEDDDDDCNCDCPCCCDCDDEDDEDIDLNDLDEIFEDLEAEARESGRFKG